MALAMRWCAMLVSVGSHWGHRTEVFSWLLVMRALAVVVLPTDDIHPITHLVYISKMREDFESAGMGQPMIL